VGKKIGADSGDPNPRSQPRLPGSVVGRRSMGQNSEANKITKGTVPELPETTTVSLSPAEPRLRTNIRKSLF